MEKLGAFLKWLSSFFKSDWQLHDYPLRFREQRTDSPATPRWTVQVVNWWQLAGVGNTKDEALANLAENFSLTKQERELPRPGTGLPIEFASGDELERYWGIASVLISEVLGYEPEGIFVSDGSSLWDFAGDNDISEYQQKIRDIFGVDVTHIESGNLVEISKFIADKR